LPALSGWTTKTHLAREQGRKVLGVGGDRRAARRQPPARHGAAPHPSERGWLVAGHAPARTVSWRCGVHQQSQPRTPTPPRDRSVPPKHGRPDANRRAKAPSAKVDNSPGFDPVLHRLGTPWSAHRPGQTAPRRSHQYDKLPSATPPPSTSGYEPF
jgi:hypothetical protein